ncbi:unnamed protein product [Nezara viridula]|uniref:Uncharacterized protein n=1 Tax=Nezara viridula TaxID=85310 RepID=A0A9P0HLK5_NEZVI|nr:unnamed protein product [Nezara viridula]
MFETRCIAPKYSVSRPSHCIKTETDADPARTMLTCETPASGS